MATRRLVSARRAWGARLPLAVRAPAAAPPSARALYTSTTAAAAADSERVELPMSERVLLDFDRHGPGPGGRDPLDAPVLFLHGLFGSKKNNRTVSRALAQRLGRYVYTLDLRNHGDSPHVYRHDYLAMAADVAGFIRDRALQNSILIGHSMGAKAAMTLCLGEPELVAGLVAVDNAPVDAELGGAFVQRIEGMRLVEEAGVSVQSDADALLAPFEPDAAVRQFLLSNLRRPFNNIGGRRFRIPLGILARALPRLGDFPFKDPALARFPGPALFVRGTRSPYVPDDVLPLVGSFFPRFRLADIDAGHWVISEKPEEFLRG
ncbi:alpha/beta-hydrolase [Durotheca rogersii]|uniref:alpha/beta-hydrolase n=1 Tax=Durotheca rogersii TaxID=419775 RepID=UPI00221F649F|nr:alpha/beta-hydrolase [Durotheca rogersii]KAI5862852.1 alpha/beta-hydrolase [Durotheca rogersii]